MIQESFVEAVGLSTYSTSQPTVTSYLSIFENFWNQVELYEKLTEHRHNSILGYAELAKDDPQYIEKQIQSFIDVVYRNAFRIQKLTKDTRIESHTLKLSKTRFNLKDVILDATKLKVRPECSNKVILEFKNRDKIAGELVSHSDIFVEADRDTMTQVISNLLDNALKFTCDGLVAIGIERKIEKKEE